MSLYFSYGSNMSREQMARRCPNSIYLGTAVLPCYSLGFGGYSRYRQGGVATIHPGDRAVKTPGILWDIDDMDEFRLNRAEGVPFTYRQIPVRVRFHGMRVRARTYQLVNNTPSVPHRDYWSKIAEIYTQHQWDTSALEPLVKPIHRVFVYGSLRQGSTNHRMLKHGTFVRKDVTAPTFKLLHLGAYPGMVPGKTSVHGEVWDVDPMHRQELDQFEGHPTLFRRQRIPLISGEEVSAYLFQRNTPKLFPVVRSGDWMNRGGLRLM